MKKTFEIEWDNMSHIPDMDIYSVRSALAEYFRNGRISVREVDDVFMMVNKNITKMENTTPND